MLQRMQSASKETKQRSPKPWDRVLYIQKTFPFVGDLYEKRGILLEILEENPKVARVIFDGDIEGTKVEYSSLELIWIQQN